MEMHSQESALSFYLICARERRVHPGDAAAGRCVLRFIFLPAKYIISKPSFQDLSNSLEK